MENIVQCLVVVMITWLLLRLPDAYGKGCKSVIFYTATKGSYLRHHVIQRVFTHSSSHCQIECYLRDNCQSYNYRAVNITCEINDSNHYQHTDDLVKGTDYVYAATKNACNNRPCPSSSVCRPDFNKNDSYKCLCQPGYGGAMCEDINECTTGSHNCPDNSVCLNNNGSYQCQCKDGYQKVLDKCFSLFAKYDITVYTSSDSWSGTNAKVYLHISGTQLNQPKTTQEIQLIGQFERSSTKVFKDKWLANLNAMTSLTIRLEGGFLASDWKLSKVVVDNKVEGLKVTFGCDCWIRSPSFRILTPK